MSCSWAKMIWGELYPRMAPAVTVLVSTPNTSTWTLGISYTPAAWTEARKFMNWCML